MKSGLLIAGLLATAWDAACANLFDEPTYEIFKRVFVIRALLPKVSGVAAFFGSRRIRGGQLVARQNLKTEREPQYMVEGFA